MGRGLTFGGLVSALVTIGVAAVIALVAVAAKALVFRASGDDLGFVVYVPAIALAAWQRGFVGGLLATVIGGIADVLIFDPLLDIGQGIYQVRLITYFVGGLSVSVLSYSLRRARDRARLDASARRQALEAEARARGELDQLIAAERHANEVRDAFNSILSHELRTPITAIYGGAKVLARRDRELDEATRTELLQDLEAEADRLYRLVEDLLVLARSERGPIQLADEPILLPRLVSRVVSSEQARWPSARFEQQAAPEMAATYGEETYVEQVLRNLLSNAAKYSPAGSQVLIAVDESEEGVRVRVLDEGPGIDAGEQDRLFELYYRSPITSASAAGAGIGLFVCRSLVEAMGGRIWARPREGGSGAEFGFVLPRYEDQNGGQGSAGRDGSG
jgi:K+-sensing histidine kinase KdpD